MSPVSWLQPILDPSASSDVDVRTARRVDQARRGVSLLLDGKFGIYSLIARDVGLPDFSAQPQARRSTALAFLTAVIAHLGGGATDVSAYAQVFENPRAESSLRTAASIMAAILLSDLDQPLAAAELIRSRMSVARDPLENAVLALHLGTRLAQAGDVAGAIQQLDRIELARMRGLKAKWMLAVSEVAARNKTAFAILLGQMRVTPTAAPSFDLLARVSDHVADGLERMFNDSFETTFRDPAARHFSWRAEDPVDSSLVGAVIRAECLSDWVLLTNSRQILGRYRLLNSLGREGHRVAPAFELLRRAGDHEGIEMAARAYLDAGSLLSLREIAEQIARSTWSSAELRPTLALLQQVSELLTAPVASEAVTKVLSIIVPTSTALFEGGTVGQAFKTLASIVQVAGRESVEEVATAMLPLLEKGGDELFLQSASVVPRYLDWAVVSRGTIEKWIDFIRRHLVTPDGRQMAAESATMGMAKVTPNPAGPAVQEAYATSGAVHLAALLVAAAGSELPRAVRNRIADQAVDELTNIRGQAAKGQYGLGARFDPALLVAWVLTESREEAGHWPDLLDFLLDPAVSSGSKIPTLDYLADRATAIPAGIGKRMLDGAGDLSYRPLPLSPPAEQLAGTLLRLTFALGGLGPEEALSRFLDLSSGPTIMSRIEAARTVGYAVASVPVPELVVLSLSLTHDIRPEVRTEAGRSLGRLAPRIEQPLSASVTRSLLGLLGEPGISVPRGTLDGLIAGLDAGAGLDPDVAAAASALAQRHPAASVRYAAGRLVVLAGGSQSVVP